MGAKENEIGQNSFDLIKEINSRNFDFKIFNFKIAKLYVYKK